ncbi:unnamed protein product [Effrenium voratum]|nr:unnamed protein product [Effrenium voratum]
MFTDRKDPPDEAPGKPKDDPLGMGSLMRAPRVERIFPDVEANRPVLAGELATRAPIVGRFSSSPRCAMPVRVLPQQLLSGAGDDPAASQEENELWRTSVDLLIETLEPLWPEAEAKATTVLTAEYSAEKRRDESVGDVRKRVLRQMVRANTGLRSEAELDDILTVLQTDERLLKYLGLLQQSCFEAEKMQDRMNRRQKEASQAKDASYAQERAEEAIQGVYSRAKSLEMRIQACCGAAEELPETYDAFDSVGEFFSKLNPFR